MIACAARFSGALWRIIISFRVSLQTAINSLLGVAFDRADAETYRQIERRPGGSAIAVPAARAAE
jgi:hypothetical protein